MIFVIVALSFMAGDESLAMKDKAYNGLHGGYPTEKQAAFAADALNELEAALHKKSDGFPSIYAEVFSAKWAYQVGDARVTQEWKLEYFPVWVAKKWVVKSKNDIPPAKPPR